MRGGVIVVVTSTRRAIIHADVDGARYLIFDATALSLPPPAWLPHMLCEARAAVGVARSLKFLSVNRVRVAKSFDRPTAGFMCEGIEVIHVRQGFKVIRQTSASLPSVSTAPVWRTPCSMTASVS